MDPLQSVGLLTKAEMLGGTIPVFKTQRHKMNSMSSPPLRLVMTTPELGSKVHPPTPLVQIADWAQSRHSNNKELFSSGLPDVVEKPRNNSRSEVCLVKAELLCDQPTLKHKSTKVMCHSGEHIPLCTGAGFASRMLILSVHSLQGSDPEALVDFRMTSEGPG